MARRLEKTDLIVPVVEMFDDRDRNDRPFITKVHGPTSCCAFRTTPRRHDSSNLPTYASSSLRTREETSTRCTRCPALCHLQCHTHRKKLSLQAPSTAQHGAGGAWWDSTTQSDSKNRSLDGQSRLDHLGLLGLCLNLLKRGRPRAEQPPPRGGLLR